MTRRRTGRDRAAAALLAVAALGAAACGSADSPTAPLALRCPPTVPLCADPVLGAAVRDALDDAATRLVPALESTAARDALEPRLAELADVLASSDVARARSSLTNARATLLETMRSSGSVDAADLDAIELMLRPLADALGVD